MRKTSIALCLMILASCSQPSRLPFFTSPDLTPQWIRAGEKAYASIPVIAPFSFTDQSGSPVTEKDVKGRIYVANFFFTTCGSICPKMMQHLKKVEQAFRGDSNVLILSHTVLPETDSVEHLKKYGFRMQINSSNWKLLTGDKERIYTLARRSYFADEELGYDRDSREFLHTENCILVDGKGRIRGVYNGTLELEMNKLIEHIRILQQQE